KRVAREEEPKRTVPKIKYKYEFDGVKYKYLRHLALAVIAKYVKDNPKTTYDELKNAFDLKLRFNNKPLIRLKKDLTEDEIKRKRAFIDAPIRLTDGNVVVVNNQFQWMDEQDFKETVNSLGIEYKDLQKEKEIEVLEKLLNEIKKLEKPVEESEEGNNNILKGSGNKKQTPSTRQSSSNNNISEDKQRYEFNGIKYKCLRHLALAVVTKYVKDNPRITYDELKNAFNIKLSFNNKPLIRLKKDLTEDEVKRKRAFIDVPIKLADGNVVVVNNQFQRYDEPCFMDMMQKLGYKN
ncbi:MAG: hypothetical protein GX905_05370, partial [Bacteroidales bacterium]|nr:hypothetical protein [Bacteroidales bacterium]